jgi:peptidoglycan hydrolase-like protein with peptidoglycan-binding domain
MMWASRAVMLVAAAMLLGGCASPRTRQELTRLQSQLGLLDERVTQLERTTVAGAGLSSEPLAAPAADGGMTFSDTKSRTSAGKQSGGAVVSASLKPGTREIQQALKNAGFYQGNVDGHTGPMTREAVKEFQRVHGLTDDGVVGRQTWAKLKAYTTLSSDGGEATAAEVLK